MKNYTLVWNPGNGINQQTDAEATDINAALKELEGIVRDMCREVGFEYDGYTFKINTESMIAGWVMWVADDHHDMSGEFVIFEVGDKL